MHNAVRAASDPRGQNLTHVGNGPLPGEAEILGISNIPTDWGLDTAVSAASFYLEGDFGRVVASQSGELLLGAGAQILPVLAFALAVFTDARAISLQISGELTKERIVSIRYDFSEAATFATLSAYTQAKLFAAFGGDRTIEGRTLSVEILNANNGKAIGFDFALSGQGVTVEVRADDRILYENWWKNFFESLEFYGAQFQNAPLSTLAAIDLVPPRQWKELSKVNDTAREFPRDSDLISVLLASASQNLEGTALVSAGEPITIKRLLAQARSIANWLTSICDPANRAVGVVVDRNENAYAVYVGILMAGGYYVPVSPQNPASRIEQIFADADVCTAIVLDEGDELSIAVRPFKAIPLDDEAQFAPRARSPESIAYAIYTSGSTGKPKGVLVTDRNVLRFAINAAHITWNADDRVGAISSHGFDASTFEIWSALLNGVPIVCLGKEAITDLNLFKRLVSEQRVTVIVITSALLTHIVSADIDALSPLRYLIYGGELTAIETVRRLRRRFPALELIHAYGPTENTVLSTFHSVEALPADRVPIGRPLANSAAWVVDGQFRPLPVGARGMLIVSGDGVAQGYVKRPDATAKHFLAMPDHLRQREGERGYITGDIARWTDRFTLEFLGRADNQIKIRGFRIELDEIRATLTGLPDVIDAEVIPVSAEHGGIIALDAFVVFEGTTADAIRAKLAEHLPDYMIPRAFHKIDSLPFNSSGKVDRQALASMRTAAPAVDVMDGRNDNDRRLLEIWKKLFGVASLSIDDSYTSLGGHSMMMLEMADMVFEEFNLDIALTDLVTLTTVRQISDALARQQLDSDA